MVLPYGSEVYPVLSGDYGDTIDCGKSREVSPICAVYVTNKVTKIQKQHVVERKTRFKWDVKRRKGVQ